MESSHSAEIDEKTAEWFSAQITRSMPSDDSKSIGNELEPQQQKGYSTDLISLVIARDVLRRGRNGDLAAPTNENLRN